MEKKILFLGLDAAMPTCQKVCRRGRYAQHRQANEAGDIFPIGNSIPASDCRSLDCHRQRCRIRHQRSAPAWMVKHLGRGPRSLAHFLRPQRGTVRNHVGCGQAFG